MSVHVVLAVECFLSMFCLLSARARCYDDACRPHEVDFARASCMGHTPLQNVHKTLDRHIPSLRPCRHFVDVRNHLNKNHMWKRNLFHNSTRNAQQQPTVGLLLQQIALFLRSAAPNLKRSFCLHYSLFLWYSLPKSFPDF
jgi:hypothetical protein